MGWKSHIKKETGIDIELNRWWSETNDSSVVTDLHASHFKVA